MSVSPRHVVHKGRGAVSNADNRFEPLTHESIDDGWDLLEDEKSAPQTEVIVDKSKSILAYNKSPDISFNQSINPYRGCEHGCVYCYARPTHAYLGYSPGLDFETKILIKPEAAALLRKQLAKTGYRCSPIGLGTNTDPYQPLERKLKITRSILEVLASCNHPFTLVTKSHLVTRDLDLIASMAEKNLCQVFLSVPTIDDELSRKLEPRTAAPKRRLAAVKKLREAGVPAGVLVAPVIPLLTDGELERILEFAAQANALTASYILLRLPLELKTLVNEWLESHYPLKAKHVISLIKQTRDGKMYQSDFGTRRSGTGQYAELIANRFSVATKRLDLNKPLPDLNTELFQPPARENNQLSLF